MAMLATVLVQDLRIQYNPEREKQLENGHILRREDEKTFFADSKDVFIHGLLTGKHYGTCASLPFLYVAIGRRLGYPSRWRQRPRISTFVTRKAMANT